VLSHKLRRAACCLLLVSSARGTSVAIMVTSRTILIAADGVDTRTVNGVDTFVPYCKIRNQGSVFFTAAGDLSIPELNFNVWRLAADAVRKSKTISGISDRIEQSVLVRLPAIVERSRVADQKTYAQWLKGTPVILIAFATFENSVPRVVAVSFPLDSRGAILKPIRNTLGGPGVVVDTGFFGYNERMKAAASRRTAASWQPRFRKHPVSFIQGLIQLEIDQAKRDHRHDVGPPIAILRITKRGGAFVPGHQGACPPSGF
jgi:hypothetical protein